MAVFGVTVIMNLTVDTDEISLVGQDRDNVESFEVESKILDDIKNTMRDAAEDIPYLYTQNVLASRKYGRSR